LPKTANPIATTATAASEIRRSEDEDVEFFVAPAPDLPLVCAQSTALWSIGIGRGAAGLCCENAPRADGTCSNRVAKLAGGALGGAAAGAGAGKLRGGSSIVPASGFGAAARGAFGTGAIPPIGAAGAFRAGPGASIRAGADVSKWGGATDA
jgi:hypothetical protein